MTETSRSKWWLMMRIASRLWREVRGKIDKARSGIGSPPFSFMNANQPLEDSVIKHGAVDKSGQEREDRDKRELRIFIADFGYN